MKNIFKRIKQLEETVEKLNLEVLVLQYPSKYKIGDLIGPKENGIKVITVDTIKTGGYPYYRYEYECYNSLSNQIELIYEPLTN